MSPKQPKLHITIQSGGIFTEKALHAYGLEVNENRAFPRIEDGLKPVQRLLLWAARDFKTNDFIKSAKIVGHVMGSYSPHGDSSSYKALVNLVNQRYALMDGHGNFGSIDTECAPQRYTEARLSGFARKIATDQPDMEVVPYEPNYDETLKQPEYMPMRVPYLLLGGSEGIGLAMNSRIPCFNLDEVVRATAQLLITGDIKKALSKIKAPDGDSCKLLSTKQEVASLFETGEGTLEYECLHSVEDTKKGKRLVITGYVPDFNLSSFLERCGRLQDEDLVDVVRNETSAENGDRIIIEFGDAVVYEKKLVPLMRKKIPYRFNVLFNRGGKPKLESCGLGKILSEWVEIRLKTVKLTLQAEIAHIEKQIGREQAKQKALLNLDKIFEALKSKMDFKQYLVEKLGFSLEHATIIAEMRVESLKRASVEEVESKLKELADQRSNVEAKLKDINAVIVDQLKDVLNWAKKHRPDFIERKTQVGW